MRYCDIYSCNDRAEFRETVEVNRLIDKIQVDKDFNVVSRGMDRGTKKYNAEINLCPKHYQEIIRD